MISHELEFGSLSFNVCLSVRDHLGRKLVTGLKAESPVDADAASEGRAETETWVDLDEPELWEEDEGARKDEGDDIVGPVYKSIFYQTCLYGISCHIIYDAVSVVGFIELVWYI